MQKFVALSVLLALMGIAYVSAQGKSPCKCNIFVRVEDCCNMPKVITADAFANCLGNTTKAAKKAQAGALNSCKSYNGYRGGIGGPACLIQCAMSKLGLLTTAGEVDEAKVLSSFTNGQDATISKFYTETIKACSNDVNNLDLSAVSVPVTASGEQCKVRPYAFMTCVKHRIASNCPAGKKITSTKDNKDLMELCAKKASQMKNCDPLALIDGDLVSIRPYKVRRKNKTKG